MKKWIKAENGKVSQVVEFDDGTRMELPLDSNGNLKWFDDEILRKDGRHEGHRQRIA